MLKSTRLIKTQQNTGIKIEAATEMTPTTSSPSVNAVAAAMLIPVFCWVLIHRVDLSKPKTVEGSRRLLV
ncbi:MAG: hypothetical protein AAFY67_23945, partial [Cyanobacteria bacterium J06642_9]